jgi:hypothetical protein
MLNSYQLSGTGTTSESQFLTLQFARPGTVKQILITGCCTSDADCNVRTQIGINSLPQFIQQPQNSISGLLGMGAMSSSITTTGSSSMQLNSVIPCNRKFSLGETLYMHVNQTGTGTWLLDILVFVEE